jgi:hypothetical protein
MKNKGNVSGYDTLSPFEQVGAAIGDGHASVVRHTKKHRQNESKIR